VVLVVVALALVATVGRPLLGDRLATLRRDYPALNYAVAALEMFRGSGSSEEEDEEGGAAGDSARSRGAKRIAGVNDKSKLPPDVPLYPKPISEMFNVGAGDAGAFQRVARPRRDVTEYFRREMKARGWTSVRELSSPTSDVAVWKKGNRSCRIEVDDGEQGSEVWLRTTAATSRR